MNAPVTFERALPAGSTPATARIVSHEPATGREVWSGGVGDVEDAVLRARRAWPTWAGARRSGWRTA